MIEMKYKMTVSMTLPSYFKQNQSKLNLPTLESVSADLRVLQMPSMVALSPFIFQLPPTKNLRPILKRFEKFQIFRWKIEDEGSSSDSARWLCQSWSADSRAKNGGFLDQREKKNKTEKAGLKRQVACDEIWNKNKFSWWRHVKICSNILIEFRYLKRIEVTFCQK